MNDGRLKSAVSEFERTEFREKKPSADNPEDFLWAIEKAYQDMMPRTIKGHEVNIKKHCSQKLYESIRATLKQDPPSTCDEFKETHKGLCRAFLNELNAELQNRSLAGQEYGKAQKIVNMTFKYLYCFDGKNRYAKWFEYSHMPLDSLLLNWYKSLPNRKVITEKAWSNLDENEYYAISDDIFSLLNGDLLYHNTIPLPKQPLFADFIIWAEEKNKIRIAELKAMLSKTAKDEAFCRWINQNDAKDIIEMATKIVSYKETK